MPVRLSSVPLVHAALCALAVLAFAPAAFAAQEQAVPSTPLAGAPVADAVPERLIVVWKDDVARPERLAARDDADAGFVRTLGDERFQLLRPQAGQSVADALAALREDPHVETVARDTYDVPHASTNDPLFDQLWGLENFGLGIDGFAGALPGADVDAAAAWDRTRGTPSTVVADLDTGYRFDAPDLGPVAWTNPADPQNGVDDDGNGIVDDTHGADFVGRSANSPATDGDPTDDDLIDGGHGVHTAGTIGAAGNNGIGISGVAQDARIMPLRVCSFFTDPDPQDSGTVCPSSSQILAINYAGTHGARAANMSLGGVTANSAVRDALAANPNVLFVVSAGNDGQNNDPGGVPHYPCAYDPSTSGIAGSVDNVICVAATDQADGLASFSDYGPTTVDVGAPGTEILSTFPVTSTLFADDFETNNFATNWGASGADGGFARANEAPLSSFGMSDSPSRSPRAGTVVASTSLAVPVPAGSGACFFSQTRSVAVSNGGYYQYVVRSNGRAVFTSRRLASSGDFVTDPILGMAGTSASVVVTYGAGSSPQPTDGVWLDDLSFACRAPLTTPPDYGFLDGTSMAAPHVTGAAALLFSLNPSASVAQVRAALMATVHPVAALAGTTVTGGRVDAAAALDEIRQPDTAITGRPRATTSSTHATFSFARSDAPIAGGFQCQLDGGPFAACSSPKAYSVRGGRHTFAVRAFSPHGIVADSSPATATWTAKLCEVPKLTAKSLRRAKRALTRAHCKLGSVKRPRHAKLSGLVVTASKPKARAVRAAGTKVKLTLARPKPKHRRHRG